MTTFPTTVEAVTAEWLTQALSEMFPDVDVAEVSVIESSSGTNNNARLGVQYQNQSGAPDTLFAKLPPSNETQRELVRMSGMAMRETGFYRDLADQLKMRVPRPYASEYDEATGDFLILIEDLADAGCRFPASDEFFSPAAAKRAVEDLADLHITHYTDDVLQKKTSWVGPQIRVKEYGAGMLELALEHCRAGLSDEYAKTAQLYIDYHDAIHDIWEEGAWSIIQGDCHWGNLFDDDGRIGFLDWGCMAYMPGMRDVSFFLCMGLDVETRRLYERDLIEVYIDRVKRGGGPVLTTQAAWELHRLHAAYTVPASAPAAVYDLIKDQVEFDPKVVAEFMRRATAAITDLDACEVLRGITSG
jgi:hypothetical protein